MTLQITDHLSPNFGERRDGARPELVVIHYTAMQTAQAALTRLCAPEFEVSAHYLICEKGGIYRLVDEEHRAWHAGAGAWGQITDVNSHSIGIELANDGQSPFAADQMDALEHLLDDILRRRNIPPEGVIGHSDMAPGRKIDPGPRFDWARLELRGLGRVRRFPVDRQAPSA
ncbi:N-acetylmuramoyl-L-alanine amidase [Celeribacter halophilus]|uniref:N-acetylmuramoyl-L-alanine amidase n=1 Tax=Celeribacter halophilus TaxID=576117 RepID=UPI003A935077